MSKNSWIDKGILNESLIGSINFEKEYLNKPDQEEIKDGRKINRIITEEEVKKASEEFIKKSAPYFNKLSSLYKRLIPKWVIIGDEFEAIEEEKTAEIINIEKIVDDLRDEINKDLEQVRFFSEF